MEGIHAENIFVIEDGVFDNTARIVKSYPEVNLIQLHKNSGAPTARNLGLSRVHSDYVMFLDADDYIENKLAGGLLSAATDTDADLILGPWRYGGDDRNYGVIRRPKMMTAQEWLISWLNSHIIPTCSVLWKTSTVKKIGGWDEGLKKNQDGELMIRAFLDKVRIAYTDEGNSVYWQHSSPNRISSASIQNRIFSSEVVFNNILAKVEEKPDCFGDKQFLYEVGRFCCKTAWFAAEGGDSLELRRWMDRAYGLGFRKQGYNKKSDFMARILGLQRAARLKKDVRPFLMSVIQR
jgi:glycosyltransferase involved in cell wall biosynthesis